MADPIPTVYEAQKVNDFAFGADGAGLPGTLGDGLSAEFVSTGEIPYFAGHSLYKLFTYTATAPEGKRLSKITFKCGIKFYDTDETEENEVSVDFKECVHVHESGVTNVWKFTPDVSGSWDWSGNRPSAFLPWSLDYNGFPGLYPYGVVVTVVSIKVEADFVDIRLVHDPETGLLVHDPATGLLICDC